VPSRPKGQQEGEAACKQVRLPRVNGATLLVLQAVASPPGHRIGHGVSHVGRGDRVRTTDGGALMHYDTNKPPALISGFNTGELRGDEWKDSTSTEWQPLSLFNHSDLSFAAKRRVRRSYPTCTLMHRHRWPGCTCTHYRPRVRSASVLRRRLPPHSRGLRPLLQTNVHDCPERSQAGCHTNSRTGLGTVKYA